MPFSLCVVEYYRDNAQKGQASSEEECLALRDTLTDN